MLNNQWNNFENILPDSWGKKTEESDYLLQYCFECTDWEVFKASALHEGSTVDQVLM